jgi:hypothetical protein
MMAPPGTRYRQNIYFGPNSVLKIKIPQGDPNKVDTVDDFLAVMYAFLLDAATPPGLLTHYDHPYYVVLLPRHPRTILGRTSVLYKLMERVPDLKRLEGLKEFIEKEVQLILSGKREEAIRLLEEFAAKTGTDRLFYDIYSKIREVKARPKIWVRGGW